jgi:SNF2 family DNA or RNA helicase
VLVLLLRLRQICSHPSLIQEDGVAFIGPDEVEDDNVKPELRGELARARQLVSPDFVKKMKDELKQVALRRIAAEQEVSI